MSSSEVEAKVTTPSTPGNGQLATVTTTYQVPPPGAGFVPRSARPHLTPAPTPEPILLAVLRKRWWLLLICAAVAAAGSFVVAERFGKTFVKSKGNVTYTSLPGAGNFKVFTPPAVETYALLMTQPEFLKKVVDEHGLEMSPAALEQSLEVEPSSKFKSITVRLEWTENEQQAVAVLNTILTMFIDQAAQFRSDILRDHISHVERLLLASSGRVDEAALRLQEFYQTSGLNGQVFAQLPTVVAAAQSSLDTAELLQSGLQEQLKTIAELKTSQLLELNNKVLDLKRNRLKAAMALYSPGHKQWKRIDEILKELDAVAPKVGATEPLAWKQLIEKIGQDVLTQPDPIAAAEITSLEEKLTRTDAMKAQLDLDLVVKGREITMLKERLEQKQGKLKEMSDEMRPQTAREKELTSELESATEERKDLSDQLRALKGIEADRVREFQKLSDAVLDPLGTSTNHRKIFLGTFFLLSLVLVSPIFGCEYFARRESPADETARKFNLPVLSRGALDDEIANRKKRRQQDENEDDPLRLLALRIQQSLHRPGSVILFSALDHEESPVSLICKLAICFAERDEAVLVLDASGTLANNRQALSALFQNTPHRTTDGHVLDPTLTAAPGSPVSAMETFGISDYLMLDHLELSDLAIPTRNEGVDCIHGGARPFPREGLATRRMTELLEQSRTRYSMILVAGPSAQQHTDLQLLAARADGLLFTVSGDRPELRQGHEVLEDLLELDAPIMGLIG